MWIPRPKELHEMFIGGTISLEHPLPNCTLKSAARNAWRSLRFEIPELVAKGQFQDGKPFMQYETPKDEDEVNKWINRTAFFDQELNDLSFEGQREKLLMRKQAFGLDTASLLLYSELDTDFVSRFHLMLNMDHEVTDGIGIRILFGKYLSLLAKFLSGSPEVGEIKWAESSRNLSPPWISIMDEEQVTHGPEYEEMVQMNKTLLLENMVIYLFSYTYQSILSIKWLLLNNTALKLSISPNVSIKISYQDQSMIIYFKVSQKPEKHLVNRSSSQPLTSHSPQVYNFR